MAGAKGRKRHIPLSASAPLRYHPWRRSISTVPTYGIPSCSYLVVFQYNFNTHGSVNGCGDYCPLNSKSRASPERALPQFVALTTLAIQGRLSWSPIHGNRDTSMSVYDRVQNALSKPFDERRL